MSKLFVKLFVLALVDVFGIAYAAAKPVSVQQAASVATTFWNRHRDCDVKYIEGGMKPLSTEYNAFHVFINGDAAGFVIVSADDCVTPILAYSFHDFFNLHENQNVKYWLSGYQEQIDLYRRTNVIPTDEVVTEWEQLSFVGESDTHVPLTAVSPLLTTTWDQSPYYNELCPTQYGQHAVTGCVATAMAQVMKYWNYPATGQGSYSYFCSGFGTVSADFGNTTYDWQNMPATLTASSSAAQRNAVATLMYHCGVSVKMQYGLNGSGAYVVDLREYGYHTAPPCAQFALVEYFGYSDSLQPKLKGNYTEMQWKSLIKNELDASRPVIYAGDDGTSGHCFVCDGYNSTETHFHFNWGWSGYCDGYYVLSDLTPGTGGTGGNSTYSFNQNQEILIGVKPSGGTGGVNEGECIAMVGDTLAVSESVNIPVNNRYRYSLSEIIVSNDELCDSMTIGEIRFYYNSSISSNAKDSVTIWLQPTAKESFSFESDIEPLNLSLATQVYKGPLNCTEGWNTFPFDTVYHHNSQLNLMIIIDDNSNDFDGSDYKFRTVDVAGYKTLAWFGNDNNPSPADSTFDGYRYIYHYRPLLIFSSHRTIRHAITVAADDSEKGMVSGGGMYNHGDVATLTATANSGYHFVCWQDGPISNPRQVVVTSDASYTAVFAADVVNYNITIGVNDPTMGSVIGGGQYPSGTIAILSALPNSGHGFVQWNDGVTNATRSLTVTGNASFMAFFTNNPSHTITVVSNDTVWGTVSGGGSYYEGMSITLVANARIGYHFVQWQDGNTEHLRTITVHENATYMAYFAPDAPQYVVMVLPNDTTMGGTSGGGIYCYGDTVSISAEAFDGYHFEYWQDREENAQRDIVVISDTLFIAFFEPNSNFSHTIEVLSANPEMGFVVGSGTYNELSTATIRAVAFEGYDFLTWHDGITTNPRSIIVTCDSTFVALFQPKQGIDSVNVSNVSVYPNPTTGKVYIESPNDIEEILLMTETGCIVQRFADGNELDLSGFPRGLYFIQIVTSESSSIYKIICR